MSRQACAIVLLGPPGSGKTTLARSLAVRGRLFIIEVGPLLLREAERDTSLGQALRPYVTAGALAPLELVMPVVSDALGSARGKVPVFDGIPRHPSQIEPFFKLLDAHSLELCAVIILALDLQAAIDRIGGRLICSRCGAPSSQGDQALPCAECGGRLIHRPDDREDIVRQRYESFETETRPVIEFLRDRFGSRVSEHPAALSPQRLADRVWRFIEATNPAAAEEPNYGPTHTP